MTDVHQGVPLKVRQRLLQECTALELLEAKDIEFPQNLSPPIEGLEVSSGWTCNQCHYACFSEGNMQRHCNSEHGWIIAQGKGWRECHVQTFFQGQARKYFVVISTQGEGVADPTEMTTKQFIQVILDEAKLTVCRA
jgi:Orsellinic acid/F9775 biosynthesis cluster protein D